MVAQKIFSKLEELFGIDVRALALMRIGFSAIVIGDLIQRSFSLTAHYTDLGILPRSYVLGLISPACINAYLMNGTFSFAATLFIITGLSALCVLIGYRTQFFTVIVWFLLQSLHFRNILIYNAGDLLLHIIFFWGMFLPWGMKYSVDAALKKPSEAPVRIVSMASVGYLLQIASFYIFSALLKSGPEWTKEGTALYYAFNVDQVVKPFGIFLLQFPELLKFSTRIVYNLEHWGSLFFFFPWQTRYVRLIMLVVFSAFHLGITLTIQTGPFQWICLVALWGFLPSFFLDKIFGPVQPSGKPVRRFFKPVYLSIFLVFCIFYTFWINLSNLKKFPYKIPHQLHWIRYTLALDQNWGMFAPYPLKEDGWIVIPGILRDGSVVDVFRTGAGVAWEKPSSVFATYKDHLWGKYYENISARRNSGYRLPYGQYLCRTWNKGHPHEKQLMAFDIVLMLEHTLPDYQPSKPRKVILWSHYCFDKGKSYPVFREKPAQ